MFKYAIANEALWQGYPGIVGTRVMHLSLGATQVLFTADRLLSNEGFPPPDCQMELSFAHRGWR